MSIADQIRTASFNGVRFKIPNVTNTTGGRKLKVHEFVNSDRREVEDLGRLNKTFQIVGIIDNSDGNYFNNRDRLIGFFESNLQGILQHPFFGTTLVRAGPYELEETIARASVATFTMTFIQTNPVIFPVRAATLLPQLTNIFNELTDNIVNNFASGYTVGDFDIVNSNDAVATINSSGDAFTESITVAGGNVSASDAAKLEDDIELFQASAFQLTKNPELLGESIISLFASSNALATENEQRIRVAKSFFGFGSGDLQIPQTSPSRIERAINRGIMNDTMNIIALMNAYINTSQKTYSLLADLEDDRALLEVQFDAITDGERTINNNVIVNLSDARGIANQNFNTLSINLNRREIVDVAIAPYAQIYYQFNGNLTEFREALNDNFIIEPAFAEGEILV